MKKFIVFFLILLAGLSLSAQEIATIDTSGTGDYSDLTSAINYLNGLTVIPTGGVTFNVTAGQTFNENPPTITAAGTETDPIIFQKSGEGDNPVVADNTQDGYVLHFDGAAWISWDAIDITDAAPEDTARFEKAVYIFASDHISILNSTITDFDKYGIHIRDASTNTVIDNNDVYYTTPYVTAQTSIYGIYAQYNADADNVTITNNKVYGLKYASSTIYGIRVWKISGTVANNFIAITDDNNDKIYALRLDGGLVGLVINAYYNTIVLAGEATDNSYCFYRTGTDGEMNVMDNIFINNRSGAFDHLIYDYTFVSGTWNADYNAYYSENGRMGDWGDVVCTTLEEWQTASGGDASSVYKAVEFAGAYDLHLAGSSVGDLDLTGTPIAGIETDIDGDTRNAMYPYMGADEDTDNPLLPTLENEYVIDNTGAGDLLSFTAAVDILNAYEIPAGGVTFNVTAGQTFNENPPTITAVGTETDPIIFQKSGEGDNPVVADNTQDGYVLHFDGAAWISWDAIDITDAAPEDTARFEKAVYIFASDHISILNSTITDFDKYGIHIRDASTNTVIDNNEVYYTTPYVTAQTSIYGIYAQFNADADNVTITNNKVYGLKYASSTIYGIRVWKISGTVANNFIAITDDNNDKIYAMRLDGGLVGLVINAYYNTIVLAGEATDNSYCFYRTGTDGEMNVMDNIFINNRSGAFDHLIYDYTFVSGTWNADYNAYYSENGRMGDWGDVVCTTLEEWQTASAGDASSVYKAVEFAGAYDLHLAGSSVGDLDLTGTPIAGIETDIDGDTRNAMYPYMGADEDMDNPLLPTLENEYVIDNTGAGDLLSFTAAFALLDGAEIPEGGIIFNVIAGQEFVEDPDTLIAAGTELAPVAFQKSGEGDNPKIICDVNDAYAVHIFESAYVTFDGIDIADNIPEDDVKYYAGYYIEDSDNIIIENCLVSDFNKYGISSSGGVSNSIIENNQVYYTANYYTTESTIYGIRANYNSEAENIIVKNNKVWGLKEGSSTVYGIDYNQLTGSVYNNFVSLTSDNNDKVYGMRVTGRSGRATEVYHNSVYVSGTATDEGYAVGVMGGGGDVTIRNNIFINDRPDTLQYSIFIGVVYQGLYLNDNLYYNGLAGGFRGRVQTTRTDDFNYWIQVTGMDSTSNLYDVEFTETTSGDLHIAGSSLAALELAREDVGVTEDIDYETRPVENLYCGADENLEYPIVTELASEYLIDNTGAGDLLSLTEAVNILNAYEIPAGGVTFNVTAGQTFNENPPTITAAGTETDPIIFQKSGEGANPVVADNTQDGYVLHFDGTAWISWDAIDITDAAPEDTARFEKAVYIFASDHISIMNSTITDFDKYGIHIRDASTNTVIDNNEVYYTTPYVTAQTSIYGIYAQFNADADNVTITNNKVYGLKYASSTIYGIRVWKISGTVANNFIAITDDNNDKIYGLRLDAGFQELEINTYYNTIVISGLATDDGYALYKTGTEGILNIYDNIFLNTRSGEFEHNAVDYTFVSGIWNADYNVYYSENGDLGYWGDTLCPELSDWQTASGADLNSVSKMVEFVGQYDLHLAGNSLGDFDLAGVPIEGITTDIDGELRHEINPYIGADENLEYPLDPQNQYVISVNPLTLNFGSNYVNVTSDTLEVSVQNAGQDELTIYSITAPELFEIRTSNNVWVSSIDEFTLEIGEIETLEVRFISETAGTFVDSLDIHSNANENEHVFVDLNALAIEPGLSVTPATIEFPLTIVGKESAPEMITIYNVEELPLMIDNVAGPEQILVSLDGENFETELNDITLLDSIQIYTIYTPQASGEYNGTIYIYSELVHGTGLGEEVTFTGQAFIFDFSIAVSLEGLWQSKAEWGDYDNDGDLDILAAGYGLPSGTSFIYVYRNDDGDFVDIETDVQGTGFGPTCWTDFDNDGDLDIFTSGQYEIDVFIAELYENVDGVFTPVDYEFVSLKSGSAQWADCDNDGDLDMLYVGVEDMGEEEDIERALIYINLGDGNFEMLEPEVLDGIGHGEAEWADYDNDGDLDIGLTGRRDNSDYITRIYRNDGDNNYVELPLDLVGVRYSVVEWGDYDSDGDLDFLVSGSVTLEDPSVCKIYRNDGEDQFVDIEADIIGVRQGDVEWGDLDNDGDLDILMNGVKDNSHWPAYFYLNQGNDVYTFADSMVSLKYANFSLADYDFDNDLDILLTGRFDYQMYELKVWENECDFVNTVPEAPGELIPIVDESEVTLTWGAASDAETPAAGLSYNIRIGSEAGSDDIFIGLAEPLTGYRYLPWLGNMGNKLEYVIPNLPQGVYYAAVQSIDNCYLGSTYSEEVMFEVTAVNSDENIIPVITELKGNYPNPFNPDTRIAFALSKESDVEISIYNIKGQKVRTLLDSRLEADHYEIIWNGKDDQQRPVTSGVYFYRMTTGKYDSTRKMIMLK